MKLWEIAMESDRAFGRDFWQKKIPFLKFPEGWEILMRPPMLGAMVRFSVRDSRSGKNEVSVYLDCHEMLGAWSKPYWEAYPGAPGGDTGRCLMEDTEELLKMIKAGLDCLATTEGKA